MNAADLSAKIETRITSDTGAGGMWASGAKLVQSVEFDTPEPGAATPYLIVTFPTIEENDVFTKDAVEFTVEFELVTERRVNTFPTDSTALDRLRSLFHRWKPTLTGNYTATSMGRITGTTAHTETERHYIEQYKVRVEWNTIGPV